MNIKARLAPPLSSDTCNAMKNTNEKDAMCMFVLDHQKIISDQCIDDPNDCSVELKGKVNLGFSLSINS